ncbi:MAG: hypothetical protein P1V81_11995 [Planctomycetota bacterium]|nr:hypothetical protein [Planctomycetota bacterium]
MSESRKGTCAECSAEYKIPASFPHDRAKCRECGGVVEIESAAGAAAPAPAPVPAAKPPEPKPQPKAEEKPEPKAEAPAEPAEKPMTMKEKILARKKAEAEAAAAAEAPKPAAKKAPAKAGAKAGAARTGAKAAGGKAGAKAGGKAGGRKAAGAKAGRGGRKGRGAEPEAEEAGGRRGRKAAPQKKSPVMGLVAVAVLVVGGGAGWYFTMGPGAKDDAPKTTVAAGDGQATEGVDEPMTGEGTDGAGEAAAPIDEGTSGKAGAEDTSGTEEPTPDPEPEAPKPEKTYDPMEVVYDEIAIFGPAIDTSDEQWAEIQELAETFADMDAGAKQGRAGRSLGEFGFRAIPAILNKMREFDLGTDEGYRLGYLFQGKMTELMNGINAGWESEKDEDGLSVPRAHRYNRKVVQTYLKTWAEVVEDPTRWIATAKLGQEKYADQLEAYSIALANAGITEGDYIDRVAGASPDSGFGDDEEGLDDF